METGYAILLSKPTGINTSKMTRGAVDRPESIRLPTVGRSLEVQPLISPYMYVALACVNPGNTNITTSHLRNEDDLIDTRVSLPQKSAGFINHPLRSAMTTTVTASIIGRAKSERDIKEGQVRSEQNSLV